MAQDVGGFDERRLIKLSVDTRFSPEDLLKLSGGVEIVSQEDKAVVLAFATEAALEEFERRLTMLAEGRQQTYRNILYALKGFDRWSEDDRRGWALRREGWPEQELFMLDVELWPVHAATERDRMWQAFERWLTEQQIQSLDSVKQSELLLYRVRTNRQQAELLLRNRDVRMVDLPPRWGLDIRALQLDIQDLPRIPAPVADSPGVAVLDSGIVQNHPLLAPAVGDAQSYVPGLGPEDEHGHGTLVAGIALYGDIAACAEARRFVPTLRLFSGRIFDARNEADSRFVENSIEEAVRYFHREYGCRVFNVSYGDSRKPYRGGRVRGLAVTLDALTRELGVLFVVPSGNFEGEENVPTDWRQEYPGYLLREEAALLDPATALNVITVGSIARWDATTRSQRYITDPAEQPIARRDCPSPFTRTGPTVGGAIKPDVAAYGGNWAVNLRVANQWIIKQGLGELSTSREFAAGRLLAEDCGTSFAAPEISHLAAQILREHPGADANLLRALLGTHARWPDPCIEFLDQKDDLLRMCGFGRVDDSTLTRSNDHEVTLIAQESIPDRSHHFFELPIPNSLWSPGRRAREISVALAHSPAVRTTRINYKATRIDFRLVSASDLREVERTFNAATSAEAYERISEISGAAVGTQRRSAGTLQADRWTFKMPSATRRRETLFLVVTRNDLSWGREITLNAEPYALAVVLRDRENTNAQLYAQVQTKLEARVRARVRV
ncbi:MAG TPA: S8 family peptidase [Terriglobia bacterium]|nr:S8 family peptidase [Terriglobia bacterium]